MAQQEKFEFHYTSQGTEFGNGTFSFHSISLQFSAPENPSVHHVKQRKVARDARNGTSGLEERGHWRRDMELSGKKRMGGFDVHAMAGTGSKG